MSVVVDANLLASQALPLPYGDLAIQRLRLWQMDEEIIIAPVLLVYELTTIMRKAITAGWLSETAAAERLSEILRTGPLLIPPDDVLNREALFWAKRIGQNKAYDSHYLALAARESATLWTADRRLANGAEQAGLAQVHWIGDWSPGENQ